jgi:hypothetical protein
MFFTVLIVLELQAQSPAAANLKLGNKAVAVVFLVGIANTAYEGMTIALMIIIENIKPHTMPIIGRIMEDL